MIHSKSVEPPGLFGYLDLQFHDVSVRPTELVHNLILLLLAFECEYVLEGGGIIVKQGVYLLAHLLALLLLDLDITKKKAH